MISVKTIPGVYGGVSQIIPELRENNECEVLENCFTDITMTTARPRAIKKLSLPFTILDNFSEVCSHQVNGEIINFLYIINSSTLYIYNLKTYTLANSITNTYFSGLTKANGRLIQNGTNVYILNGSKVVSVDTSVNSDSTTQYNKLLYVMNGLRPAKYKVLNGTDNCTTSIASDAAGNSVSLTDDICSSLYTGSNVGDCVYSGFTGGISALISGTEERSGSVIYFPNSSDISNLYVEDSLGNNGIKIINGKTESFGNLPPLKHQVTIEVTGKEKLDETSVYYEFIDNSWKESYKKTYIGDTEIYRAFKTSDMPIVIQCLNGIFSINSSITYKPRMVGNEISNPLPLFVGTTINDMFIYQNRMCFLSDNGVSFSEIGDFTNFFRNTTRGLLNYDAFNFKLEVTNGVSIKNAVPFNSIVVLFDNNNQYNLQHFNNTLGQQNINVTKTTNFQINNIIKPRTTNNELYFINNRNNKTIIYRYLKTKDGIQSENVTLKVPNFIDKDISFISSANSYNLLFLGSGNNNVFVNIGGAWGKWTFGNYIKNIHNIDSKNLYLLSQNSLFLMDLDKLSGSSLYGNNDSSFIDDTDSGTYTFVPKIELSKQYTNTMITKENLPVGNYRLKQLSLGSFDNLKVVVTDKNGSYENTQLLDNSMELISDLKYTKIEIIGTSAGFYFTSVSFNFLYSNLQINK